VRKSRARCLDVLGYFHLSPVGDWLLGIPALPHSLSFWIALTVEKPFWLTAGSTALYQ
jgi:hypothetical protein